MAFVLKCVELVSFLLFEVNIVYQPNDCRVIKVPLYIFITFYHNKKASLTPHLHPNRLYINKIIRMYGKCSTLTMNIHQLVNTTNHNKHIHRSMMKAYI